LDTSQAKSRFDTTAEELERILIAKEGENVRDSGNMVSPGSSSRDKRGLGKAMAKGGMLFKSKGPAQMQRQEDEVRQRMNSASEVFRKAVQSNQQAKQEYFNLHLPKILRVSLACKYQTSALHICRRPVSRSAAQRMRRRDRYGYAVSYGSIRVSLRVDNISGCHGSSACVASGL
jgi:hypothetical protein